MEAFHYQLDHLGTPQELTADNGESVWSARYTAYGQAKIDKQTLTNPLRFQGQYFDPETGLHYNRHRYYTPDSGRYLTPDPAKLAGGLNSYRYVLNPTGWMDPLGLNGCPGGDGCKPAGGVEDPAGKARVDEGEPPALSSKTETRYLYRGDSRHPDEVFKDGFNSRGDSKNLYLHARNSANPPSNFVSTSPSRKEAMVFATTQGLESGFIYTLRKIPGIDVNKELGSRSQHANEREIAIPNRIDTKDIIGATPVDSDGKNIGYSLINPNRE